MMLPFMKIEICLPGDPAAGKPEAKTLARIQPAEIESFNSGYDFGTIIVFKSGDVKMVDINADNFEAMLTEYWKKVNQQMAIAAAARSGQAGAVPPSSIIKL